jgi:hypothetical protein
MWLRNGDATPAKLPRKRAKKDDDAGESPVKKVKSTEKDAKSPKTPKTLKPVKEKTPGAAKAAKPGNAEVAIKDEPSDAEL